MKKKLLFNLSNFRAVALCLAFGCSTLAGWAIGVGDTFTANGVSYKVVSFGGEDDPAENKVEVASQTLTGDVVIPFCAYYMDEGKDEGEDDGSGSGRRNYDFIVTSFDLSKMTISDDLTSLDVDNEEYSVAIPNNCFYSTSKLKSVAFSGTVTTIGTNAFYECSSLSSITIPDGVTSIENSTFAYCQSLADVTIPSSVTSIGYYAFNKCKKLPEITLPSSVRSISDGAFSSTGLTKIIVPEGVTIIKNSTFAYCESLADVTIPSTVTSIGDFAFANCSSLTKLTINNYTPPTVGEGVFGGVNLWCCTLVVSKYLNGDLYEGKDPWNSFNTINSSGVEDVTVDDNAVEVARYNVNGVKLSAPQKGINIIKMSDGAVKKVIVTE